MTTKEKCWTGAVKSKDDFNYTIVDEFIDGKTVMGPWAIMTPEAFLDFGLRIGTGYGQRYRKQADGRWLKVEG